jgi:hypothetical protein
MTTGPVVVVRASTGPGASAPRRLDPVDALGGDQDVSAHEHPDREPHHDTARTLVVAVPAARPTCVAVDAASAIPVTAAVGPSCGCQKWAVSETGHAGIERVGAHLTAPVMVAAMRRANRKDLARPKQILETPDRF